MTHHCFDSAFPSSAFGVLRWAPSPAQNDLVFYSRAQKSLDFKLLNVTKYFVKINKDYYMITFEELEKSDFSKLPIKDQIEAMYGGTCECARFARYVMIPVLKGQFGLKPKEDAIVGTYFRMYAWLETIVRMNNQLCYQGVASALRSLFELAVDMKILSSDKSGIMIKRYHSFPDVEKYRRAKRLVEFCNARKSNINCSQQKEFIKMADAAPVKIEQTIINNWGKDKKGKPNWPDHWTGADLRNRVHKFVPEYEEMYVESYHLLSWFVHSGATSYRGLTDDTFQRIFFWSQSVAQNVFLESTKICARELKMDKVITFFSKALDDIKIIPGTILMKKQIEYLEKARKKM